jgi:hypothetical protein
MARSYETRASVVGAAVLLLGWTVVGQAAVDESQTSAKKRCEQLVATALKELRANNIGALEPIVPDLQQTCGSVASPKDLASLYEGIAWVYYGNGQPEKALDLSERCLSVYNPLPGCHLIEAKVLLERGSRAEGVEALTKAKQLAEACIDHEVIEAGNASNPKVKRYHEARLEDCRSTLGACSSMQKDLGLDAK